MWSVYDDNNNRSWDFDDKESMLEFIAEMDRQGVIDDSWWVGYDYFDRSKRNESYPITDFVYLD